MKTILKIVAVAALMSSAGCSTLVPVVVPPIEIPFPTEGMTECPDLDELPSTDPKDLKPWIAKFGSEYGLCAARKKALADYIVRNRK
ncbi:hypothetical protein LXA47_31455 [Massilia sp. P8910]|uniref:hypothetical protein n=1 Tax=Massilia antarctica TaxID=2765360 RepID=UPI001E328A86|nr:hypothetical protein [Massilia antarctica]MCE3608089.1 hypothetical protein [Massilia antarctica]